MPTLRPRKRARASSSSRRKSSPATITDPLSGRSSPAMTMSRVDFPEQALKAKGVAVEIHNAGVSGDTASGGLARLDWSVPEGTDAVIIELGANDALRGLDPKVTRDALDKILRRLTA